MSLSKHQAQRSLFEVDMLFSGLFDSNPAADRFSFFAENILPQLQALGPKLEGMYCEDNGRPGGDPVRMLGVVILQFMERKPDREAAQCCTFDLRWKLALGMEAGEKAFHSTSLVRFRQRLLDHEFECLGFEAAREAMREAMREAIREAGYLGRKNKSQRLDSTHVVGLISRMSRLENVRESMRLALEELERLPDLARPEGWPVWWERYVESKPDYRVDKTELQKRFKQAGEDVQAMLGWIEALFDEPDRSNSVRLLRRVFQENFETLESGQCAKRHAQPPGAVHNPHDPEAQWSSKSTTKDKEWVGYKAQVAETVAQTICQPGEPTANVITALLTQEAITSDKATISSVEAEWEEKRIEKPDILYVDGGYTSGAELAHAIEEGRLVQGPMARAPVKDKRFCTEEFDVCVEERRATCPADKSSSQCSRLAEQLRLGILPECYVYPPEVRPMRDLLRRRMFIVQQRTSTLLSVESLFARHGWSWPGVGEFKEWTEQHIESLGPDDFTHIQIKSMLELVRKQDGLAGWLESKILENLKPKDDYQRIQQVPGIGKILGMVILLESGDFARFASAGDYASYCRTVKSQRLSNQKKKGQNNRKNGNRYLSWAFAEAAVYAIRYYPPIKAWYERKKRRSNVPKALRALACKLAKAAWYVMRGHEFKEPMLFG